MTERTPFYPLPETTAPAREAVPVGLALVPPELIRHVSSNKTARDMLPKNAKYLTSPDFLRTHVYMSVPFEFAEHVALTPFCSGRAVILGVGHFPYGEAVGTVLSGKGSWVSGAMIERMKYQQGVSADHPGLLSLDGANTDTRISNALIAHGFRSALHPGYVVFDNESLKSWLLYRWRPYVSVVNRSIWDLQKIGENAAYLFRLGGSTERLANYLGGRRDGRMKAEIKQSAVLFLTEMTMENSQVSRAAIDIGDLRPKAIGALTNLSRGKRISNSEYRALAHFGAALFGRNANAMAVASRELTGEHIIGSQLSEGKDVDVVLFSYDYDVATGSEDTPIRANRALYLTKSAESLYEFFNRVSKYYLTNPAGVWYTPSEDYFKNLIQKYYRQTYRP